MGRMDKDNLQNRQQEAMIDILQEKIERNESSSPTHTNEQATSYGKESRVALRPQTGVSRVSRKTSEFADFGSKVVGYRAKDDEAKIQIQKKCISCSDQPGKLVQLFKMACLTYFPGKVIFQGAKHSRYDLIKQLNDNTITLQHHLEETRRKTAQVKAQIRNQGEDDDPQKLNLPPNILEEI